MKKTILLLALLSAAVGCAGVDPESVGEAREECVHSEDIVTNDLYVTVSNGATLHVVEKYASSALHGKRRAVLMLPASLVTNVIWNADVPGHPEFNGLTRAAQAGFISYTLDYEGYGTSTGPEDGKSVDAQRLLDDAGDLVRWIRKRHNVSKVDLIGSSVGSSIALGLGSTLSPVPHQWIGHIVLTADVYKQVTPFMAQAFFTPSFEAFLNSVPNGYMFAPPEAYGLVLVAADPAAQNYCFQNCPGLYAVGPTLTGFHLPVFAAQTGRAPMLQFWGSADMVTPLSDAQQLQAEYGGPHSLVVLNGGAHVPQWESVRDQFWDKTFSFLSPHPSHEADDDDE